jgi:hypothetical protein
MSQLRYAPSVSPTAIQLADKVTPSWIVSHNLPLDEEATAVHVRREHKQTGGLEVLLLPHSLSGHSSLHGVSPTAIQLADKVTPSWIVSHNLPLDDAPDAYARRCRATADSSGQCNESCEMRQSLITGGSGCRAGTTAIQLADKVTPSWIVSHNLPLDDAPDAYAHFDARDPRVLQLISGTREATAVHVRREHKQTGGLEVLLLLVDRVPQSPARRRPGRLRTLRRPRWRVD